MAIHRVAVTFLLGVPLVVAEISPPAAIADIVGIKGSRWDGSGSRSKEPWQKTRILLAGGVAIPATFPSGWRVGAVWAFEALTPVHPAVDVSAVFEGSDHRFDASELGSGATVPPVSKATFADFALGIHVHRTTPGLRPFGLVELALPDISRPTIFYSDASGSHTIDGTEIFGLDPGFAFGGGFEYVQPSKIGAAVELRSVAAPGRTEPAEWFVILRAGLSVPLPF